MWSPFVTWLLSTSPGSPYILSSWHFMIHPFLTHTSYAGSSPLQTWFGQPPAPSFVPVPVTPCNFYLFISAFLPGSQTRTWHSSTFSSRHSEDVPPLFDSEHLCWCWHPHNRADQRGWVWDEVSEDHSRWDQLPGTLFFSLPFAIGIYTFDCKKILIDFKEKITSLLPHSFFPWTADICL